MATKQAGAGPITPIAWVRAGLVWAYRLVWILVEDATTAAV